MAWACKKEGREKEEEELELASRIWGKVAVGTYGTRCSCCREGPRITVCPSPNNSVVRSSLLKEIKVGSGVAGHSAGFPLPVLPPPRRALPCHYIIAQESKCSGKNEGRMSSSSASQRLLIQQFGFGEGGKSFGDAHSQHSRSPTRVLRSSKALRKQQQIYDPQEKLK